MSKSEVSQKDSKEIFYAYQKNIDEILNSVKRYVPQYHQSITNVQQEYLQAFENLINSTLSLQHEYAKKIGIVTNVPEVTPKIMYGFTEEFIKTSSTYNQIILTIIDSTQQNIKTFNNNIGSFVDLHRNFLRSWISVCGMKCS